MYPFSGMPRDRVSPEVWLDLQSDYDLRVMRRTTWPKIEPKIRVRAA